MKTTYYLLKKLDQHYIYMVSELKDMPMMNMSIIELWLNYQHDDNILLPFGCSELRTEARAVSINTDTIQKDGFAILDTFIERPKTCDRKPEWLTDVKPRDDENIWRTLYTKPQTIYVHLVPIKPFSVDPMDTYMEEFGKQKEKSTEKWTEVDPTVPVVREQLKEIMQKERVLVTGCFDLFHAGHVHFLNEVHKHYVGEDRELHVGIPDDTSVTYLKNRKPVYEWIHRAGVVASVGVVTAVHEFQVWTDAPPGTQGVEDGHRDLIKKVKPVLFVDSRQKPKGRIGAIPYLEEKRIPLKFVDSIDLHTTDIINAIKKGSGV